MRWRLTEARNLAEEVERALSTLQVRVSAGVFAVPSTRIELRADQRHARLSVGNGEDLGPSGAARVDRAIERSWSRAGVAACSAKSLKIVSNLVLDERGRPECDAELSLHVEKCAECRHVAALYGALLDGFYALSAPQAPADMAARVLVDIGPRRSSTRGTWSLYCVGHRGVPAGGDRTVGALDVDRK